MTESTRHLRFYEAINEAIDVCMARDETVYVMGLGVPDPKGVFGTTLNLQRRHGARRVLDTPASENGMTGVALGSCLAGLRPIITHQRTDFSLLSMDQLVGQAANWHYMFDGQARVPLVVRMVIGRGWGQGPQHSQNVAAWFAHVPGLKVVVPTTPYDAKGLLVSSIEDDNPVVFIEHRWLHNTRGPVPEGIYRVPIGQARIIRPGTDVTVAATSHMTLEALRAADHLAAEGVSIEVIDMRSLKPLDTALVVQSVRRTGRLIVADGAWKSYGASAEIVARVTEDALDALKCPPRRVTLPDCPTPTTPALARHYYPNAAQLGITARQMLGLVVPDAVTDVDDSVPVDVPDPSFMGPF